MSKQKIKEAALNQFYKSGYEGVRMTQIAEEAGIRKQTLSYHYPSKKDLFMEIYKEVVKEEIKFTQSYFEGLYNRPSKEIIWEFLKTFKLRAHDKPNTGFLQVVSFSTPLELESYVSSNYLSYMNILRTEIKKIFEKETFNVNSEEATVYFLVLFDGLIVQLLYNTKQSFDYSLEISFKMFWASIIKR
ncbi:transcriptional regulator, TetR family [Bacillus sp. JCM 19047]|nr:transcriptional regulator, TetR family [Bacillus sp. JCM 19047]